jgi:hypothetical protein
VDFCIELLNQQIQYNEYESPLVCALAVLGVSERGWREADSYPPITSAVIKCARFMVVQKAVHVAGPAVEDEEFSGGEILDFESDSGYGSGDSSVRSSPPRSPPRGEACSIPVVQFDDP